MDPALRAMLERALGRAGAVPLASTLMELTFPDVQGLDDLRTYVARAKAADEDGAIRLQAQGQTLAAYVGVLPGSGLMAEGVVIGLRAMPLAAPAAPRRHRLARPRSPTGSPGRPARRCPSRR